MARRRHRQAGEAPLGVADAGPSSSAFAAVSGGELTSGPALGDDAIGTAVVGGGLSAGAWLRLFRRLRAQ